MIFRAAFLCSLSLTVSVTGAEPEVDFNREVRPILSDTCFICHGPDANAREADLRLDLEQHAKKSAIVPGQPDKSELIQRITSTDEDLRMPPADSNLSLTKEEQETLKRWVAQGAKWNQHWSFQPIRKVTPPEVQNKSWPRKEIDRFILHRLEQAKLVPAVPADKARWLRRVTFDLTGLPPTLAELDTFIADDSPQAEEKVIDRLLESVHYGERMASEWLDVARYSDTFGFQVDRDRYVWPWRDWVIRSFNANLPYDRFITLQLAGDLLPNATDDDVLATTFNRLHPQKVEGGSVPEEFRIEYVADRTQTFATAFLGLTLECCRCHDHKYDPLSQKEYYQFSAFFDKIDEAGLYSYFTNSTPTPTLRLTDDGTKQKIAANEDAITKAVADLEHFPQTRRDAFTEWLKTSPPPEIPNRIAHLDFEKQSNGANKSVPGKVGKAIQLSGDDGIGLKVGNFRRYEPFSVSLWMNTPDVKERAVVFHRSRAWTDSASRGYQLLIEDGRLSASLIHFWPGNAIRVRTREKITPQQWQHVAITYDGSSKAAGLKIFLNGSEANTEVVRDHLYKNITGSGGDNITIGQRFRDRGFTKGLVDEFQVFHRELTPIEIAQLHDNQTLKTDLVTPTGQLTEAQRERLFAYYLFTKDDEYKKQLTALQKLREQRSKLTDGLQEIMVMQEAPQPRQSYLLKRGLYSERGEMVTPETPSVFPPRSPDQPANRLGLAKWLTDPSHPLTARVVVNRYWQMLMGQGLVRTPEDFGSQGQLPTHPELLDWLAKDFVDHGWNVKRLMKLITMSATYRQSSSASKESIARDPENLLLSRSPTYRMPAEMLRDNVLAVSGLLVRKTGGASVRPYEVTVSFKPVKHDKNDGLYRRSLYTYWKRTGPAPVMMALDASKRDVCRVKRERTSSPLQTLVLMNGPQFVEAARVLGERVLKAYPDKPEAALSELFRLLTSRPPTADELAILTELYQEQLTYFTKHPDRAKTYLNVGERKPDSKLPQPELAALSTVANTLFVYDDCVTKR